MATETLNNNMKLWDAVCETDPSNTKPSDYGRKYTAIDPHSQVMAATKQFGAAGEGWGWEVVDVQYPPNDTVAVRIRVWHGVRGSYFEQWGQCGVYTNNDKTKDDQECMKKATTDGLTKCLSYLGFNADVFLGKFDDSKYVASMVEAHKEVVPYQPTEDEKRTINDICHLIKCGQSEADMANVLEEYQEEMNEFDVSLHEGINSQCAEMKAVWKAGNQAQSYVYVFNSVKHACDSYVEMTSAIKAFDNLPMLEAYYQKWKHRIDALEGALKADKYVRDGISPHTALANLYNSRIKELN